MKSLSEYREEADRALAEYRHAAKTVVEERAIRQKARTNHDTSIKAQKVLQHLAKIAQEKAHNQIATVVTNAIRAAGWDYDFKILFEEKRGKTEARMVFSRNGHEIDPTGGAGGGVVDVAALALRVAAVLLSVPRRRKLLVLDEPFRGVNGARHRRLVAQLVVSLAEKLDFQLVIATGHDWLRVGKVIEIGETDGED